MDRKPDVFDAPSVNQVVGVPKTPEKPKEQAMFWLRVGLQGNYYGCHALDLRRLLGLKDQSRVLAHYTTSLEIAVPVAFARKHYDYDDSIMTITLDPAHCKRGWLVDEKPDVFGNANVKFNPEHDWSSDLEELMSRKINKVEEDPE